MNEHYQNIKGAIIYSFNGESPLTIDGIARAITEGLWNAPKRQIEALVELATALLEQTGTKYTITNE